MSVPNKVLNKDLYIKIREKVKKDIPNHSAYRSMIIMKEYQKAGGKIDMKLEKKSGLRDWIKEDWRNLTPYAEGLVKSIKDTPKCGKKDPKQKGPSVCRPLIKVNDKTPNIATTYTKKQIKKAVEIKKSGKIIKWDKL